MNEPVAVPIKQTETEDILPSKVIREKEYSVTDEGLDLSSYRGTHDTPFVADYFDVRNLYKSNDKVKENVDEITEYLIKRTEGQSIVYVVKEILNEIGQEMNLKGEDAGLYKLKKILGYIRMKTKLDAIDNLKRKILDDIENVV